MVSSFFWLYFSSLLFIFWLCFSALLFQLSILSEVRLLNFLWLWHLLILWYERLCGGGQGMSMFFELAHGVCYATAFCRSQTKVLHVKKVVTKHDKPTCMDPVHTVRFTAHKLWIALGLVQSKYPKKCFACSFNSMIRDLSLSQLCECMVDASPNRWHTQNS